MQKTDMQTEFARILEQVRKAVVGKDETLMWILATMLAGGHILLEDIPGVGKTTMALAFSKALGLSCNRMQFTPDVLPSDVTGYSVLKPGTFEMTYQPGSVLCNLFLADELNRATSRTQAALLEAMEEGQVTVDGVTHPLPRPFMVIATQNPTGAAGTQLLPDSQIDRFMVRLSLGYPAQEDEVNMVLQRQGGDPLSAIRQVLSTRDFSALQQTVAETYLSKEVVQYGVRLIDATRNHVQIQRGASPRTTLAMMALAKALARIRGRDYVVPGDVQRAFVAVTAHRLQLTPQAQQEQRQPEELLKEILRSIKAPKLG